MITSSRSRMIRGETQFNRVSRFVKEIPKELFNGEIYEPRTTKELIADDAYQKAKKAFRTATTSYSAYGQAVEQKKDEFFYDTMENRTSFSMKNKPIVYTPVSNQQVFSSVNTQSMQLGYEVGDRVRHMKFGEGEVMAIVEGGRDYEITVDFDKAGTKKMFASFAKLKKI